MKTNVSILFLLCREEDEKYQNVCTREDMSGVPQNFIFYEIVRSEDFNFSQQPRIRHSNPSSAICKKAPHLHYSSPFILLSLYVHNILTNYMNTIYIYMYMYTRIAIQNQHMSMVSTYMK
jgi:hypothetical protein